MCSLKTGTLFIRRFLKKTKECADLSFWRGGQLQNGNNLWLHSAVELKNTVREQHDSQTSFSSAKQKLETEWEMCRREFDARIALVMLMEGRGNSATASSPTSLDQTRPPVQLMKLLDGAGDPGGGRRHQAESGLHYFSEDQKRQVRDRITFLPISLQFPGSCICICILLALSI